MMEVLNINDWIKVSDKEFHVIDIYEDIIVRVKRIRDNFTFFRGEFVSFSIFDKNFGMAEILDFFEKDQSVVIYTEDGKMEISINQLSKKYYEKTYRNI